MKILGIDVGAGTKDVLLYDSGKNIENCVKMVLPSPTPLYANKIRSAQSDLYIDGYAIGGGSITTKLKEHVESGYAVFMTEKAAFTLYNRLERVRALGVQIVGKPPEGFNGGRITLDEVKIDELKFFLKSFDETLEDLDGIAIAVQDHGIPSEGISQNEYRLYKFKEHFKSRPNVHDLVFSETEIPECYARMKSTVESIRRIMPKTRAFVMDSTVAAVAGCLYDRPDLTVSNAVTALNVGNSHVTAAIVADNKVLGFMEHHTHALTPEKLEVFIRRLQSGNLTEDEVSQNGGHGAFYLTRPEVIEQDIVLVTGPQRMMAKGAGLKVHFGAPTGDVMLTGTFGLVKSVERKLDRQSP